MRTHVITLGVLLAAAPAPAFADSHNELSIGSFGRAMHASSANAITPDSLGGGVLGYARELALPVVPRLALWATAGLSWGGASGTMFSTLATELDTVALTLGGRARYQLHRLVAVGGRLDVGSARAKLTLREGARTLSDHGWGGTSTAAASVDLLALAYPRFKLGFRFELGYTATTAIALAPAEGNDASTIQLQMSQASIGHLDVGGRFVSFTAISQF
jgi:hypothetical protein